MEKQRLFRVPCAACFVCVLMLAVCVTAAAVVQEAEADDQSTGAEIRIRIGKTLTAGGLSGDQFTFELLPVQAKYNEADQPDSNGSEVDVSQIPMPDGKKGERKTISTSGHLGQVGQMIQGDFGRITYDRPGYYMYRVRELIPANKIKGMIYDDHDYYVVVYVTYKGESDEEDHRELMVDAATAWRNDSGSTEYMPDLSDMAYATDSSASAKENTPDNMSKIWNGRDDVLVQFWNKEEMAELELSKNVKGSLGDLTKGFEYTIRLKGLGSSGAVHIIRTRSASVSEGSSFTADSQGNAVVHAKMTDGGTISITQLPLGTEVTVTEAESDHIASYIVQDSGGQTIASEDAAQDHLDLTTKNIEIQEGGKYQFIFTNTRNITTITGIELPVFAEMILAAIILLGFAVLYWWKRKGKLRLRRLR